MKTIEKVSQLKELYAQYKEKGLQDYFTFLRFKSISTEPEYRTDLLNCAEWVISYLKGIGFEVELWQTSGYPSIFARHMGAGPDQPTLLIYNHYDVQPVDPLDLWTTPPFEPSLREGQVYARGAQDNKGQCFYVLLALKALIESTGGLPINVKLCIEGEEEAGSSGLSEILSTKTEELKADYVAIVDLGIDSMKKPSITLGFRGITTMDVELSSSKTDLHSGMVGGIVFNPIHALVQILASMRDQNGKITIPGFYADVKEMSEEARAKVQWDFDAEEFEQTFGTVPSGGEKEFSPKERNWLRPTLEINGISGGYSGKGFKTVIPAKASAKVSCRLVPNQKPLKIATMVSNYIKSRVPEGVAVEVRIHEGRGDAVRADASSPAAVAFAKAYSEVFEIPCQFIYNGASIPVTSELAKACGGDIVLLGLGMAGDCIHAPNEHFGVDRIEIGFLTIARALQLLRKS